MVDDTDRRGFKTYFRLWIWWAIRGCPIHIQDALYMVPSASGRACRIKQLGHESLLVFGIPELANQIFNVEVWRTQDISQECSLIFGADLG